MTSTSTLFETIIVMKNNVIKNEALNLRSYSTIKLTLCSHLPMYPFVENSTELIFQITDSKTGKPLELTHMHISIIKNVTAGILRAAESLPTII